MVKAKFYTLITEGGGGLRRLPHVHDFAFYEVNYFSWMGLTNNFFSESFLHC